MTKEKFEENFGEKLNLSEKKWMLMSPRANKDNNLVIISGYREIDFDYLYFIYKDDIWEMYLNGNVRYYEGTPYTTRELFALGISSKKTLEYFPAGNSVVYRSSGIKGQVIVALDYFATKVHSILESSITIKVPEEVLKTKITVPKRDILLELGDYLLELGYHTSIIRYVSLNIDINLAKKNDEWDSVYLGTLIENAKFVTCSTKNAIEENKHIRTFETGSKRDDDSQKPLVNHLDPYLRIRFGYLLRNGANKYTKGNWKMGQPDEAALESLHRHLAKYELNLKNSVEQDEDHLSAIIFNVQLLMMNEEKKGIKVDQYLGKTK